MKKAILAALVLSVFAAVARAQNIPLADVSGGYSMLQVVKGSSLTAEGGSGSVALNFNNWLGAVGDFALYHSAVVGPGLAAGTYTFGPRFSYRKWGRITPFTQVYWAGCDTQIMDLSSAAAAAQTSRSTTLEDSLCGRKQSISASERMRPTTIRCGCASDWFFALEEGSESYRIAES